MSESVECLQNEEYIDHNRDEIRIPRPPNAFMIFGQKFRKIFAKQFEELSNKDISKLLGEEWRKMDGQTKSYYHNMADEAHRKHLQKYPGYYYSPLEARQRKAERKRKSKMSKINDNTDNKQQIIGAFIGNRPILFPNPMYRMVRPMFGPFLQPRMGFGPRFFRPNYSFGGLVPLVKPQPYPIGQVIQKEFIDGNDSPNDVFETQTNKISFMSELNEAETDSSKTQVKQLTQSTDFGLLTNFLPPMYNPNIEVIPVQQNEDYLMDQNSMNDNCVTKMSNAIPQQKIKSQLIKDEGTEDEDIQSFQMDSQVFTKSVDHLN